MAADSSSCDVEPNTTGGNRTYDVTSPSRLPSNNSYNSEDSDNEMSPLKPPSIASTIPYCHRYDKFFSLWHTEFSIKFNQLIIIFYCNKHMQWGWATSSHNKLRPFPYNITTNNSKIPWCLSPRLAKYLIDTNAQIRIIFHASHATIITANS